MSVRIGVETIAAWTKNDVDLIVGGKEPLCLSRRFEPTHYFLSLPGRSVRSFCPIVQSFVGSVISLWCLRSDRLNVTAQFISNDNSRLTIAGEQALEKAHRCLCVTSLLHQNIKCVAVSINSTPQPKSFTTDLDNHLIKRPLVCRTGAVTLNAGSEKTAKTSDPIANRFTTDDHTTLRQQVFNVCTTERKTMISPNSVSDDVTGKTKPLRQGIDDGICMPHIYIVRIP